MISDYTYIFYISKIICDILNLFEHFLKWTSKYDFLEYFDVFSFCIKKIILDHLKLFTI